ncbi:GNAT family N-acetyltransferase [Vibrio profundum]
MKADYPQLLQWINNDDLDLYWSGQTYQYPLTIEQIAEHVRKPEVFAFLYVVDGNHIGFVELYKETDKHCWICRVYIAEGFRGQGHSRVMLEQLMARAIQTLGSERFSLGVFVGNGAAQRCYHSLGFKTTAIESEIYSYRGKSYDLEVMEKYC